MLLTNVTISILDIIHRSVFYLKEVALEILFWRRRQNPIYETLCFKLKKDDG
jgi:hypothetical protein